MNTMVVEMRDALNKLVVCYKAGESPLESSFDPSAYVQVMDNNPSVVLEETDPALFLQRENGNVCAAVRRLMLYWEHRKQILGSLAFRRLCLGEGFSVQDAAAMKSGRLSLLPNDKHGRSVMLIDLSSRSTRTEDCSRALLYALHLACKNQRSQSEGVVLLFSFSENRDLTYFDNTSLRSLLLDSAPVKLHSIHLACWPDRLLSNSECLNELIPRAHDFCGNWSSVKTVITHVTSSSQEVYSKLEAYGFLREGIPASLGGVCDRHSWLKELELNKTGTKPLSGETNRKRPQGLPVDETTYISYAEIEPYVASLPRGNIKAKPAPLSTLVVAAPEEADTNVHGRESSSGLKPHVVCSDQRDGALETKLKEMKSALDELSRNLPAGPELGFDPETPDPRAYQEVKKNAPELIESESNPLLFLRFENGNVEQASRRLLSYWNYRKEIFGSARYILPLKLGHALSKDELDILKAGPFVRLPCDRNGRCVVFTDLTRRPKDAGEKESDKVRARMVFFVLSLVSMVPSVQTDGAVFLSFVSEKSSNNLPNREMLRDLLLYAFPVKVHDLHIACCPPAGQRRLFVEHKIPSAQQTVGGIDVTKTVKSHIGESLNDLVDKLAVHGFVKKSLPASVGGTWCYDEWLALVDQQLASSSLLQDDEDRKLPPVTIDQEKPKAAKRARVSEISGPAVEDEVTACEDRLQRAGRPKDGYKTLPEDIVLPSTGIPVEHQYRGPFSEHLVRKLDKAMEEVPEESFDGGEHKLSKEEYLRRKNAIVSRRKYYKKKLKIESLCSSKTILTEKNESLKKENLHLQRLLSQANTLVQVHEASSGQSLSMPQSSVISDFQRQPVNPGMIPGVELSRLLPSGLNSSRLPLSLPREGHFPMGLLGGATGGSPFQSMTASNDLVAARRRNLATQLLLGAPGTGTPSLLSSAGPGAFLGREPIVSLPQLFNNNTRFASSNLTLQDLELLELERLRNPYLR